MFGPVLKKEDESRVAVSDLDKIKRDDPSAKLHAVDQETKFKTEAHAEFQQGEKPDLFVTSDIRSEIKTALSKFQSQEVVEEASLASVHAQTTQKALGAAAQGKITTSEAEAIIAEGNMRDSAVRKTTYESEVSGNLLEPENGPADTNAIGQDERDPLAVAGARPEGPQGIENAEALQLREPEGLLVDSESRPVGIPGAQAALEAAPQTKEQELATSLRGIIADIAMLEEERDAVPVELRVQEPLAVEELAAIDMRGASAEETRATTAGLRIEEERAVELDLEPAALEALETGARIEESAVAAERLDTAAPSLKEQRAGKIELEPSAELEPALRAEPEIASSNAIAEEMRARLEVDTRPQEEIDTETLAALDRYLELQTEGEQAAPVTGEDPIAREEVSARPAAEEERVEFNFGPKPAQGESQTATSFVVREEPAPAPEPETGEDFRSSVIASGEAATLEEKESKNSRDVELGDNPLNFSFPMNAS